MAALCVIFQYRSFSSSFDFFFVLLHWQETKKQCKNNQPCLVSCGCFKAFIKIFSGVSWGGIFYDLKG